MDVYLDNNRMSAIDPQVFAAMEALLKEPYGELHAFHKAGAKSRKAYTQAMEKLYATLHASEESDLFFTSGEAENHSTLFSGIYISQILTGRKNNLILSERESPAALEAAKLLESQGCKVHYLPLNEEGVVDAQSLYDFITPRTALVSVRMVDPESGAIHPVEEIAEICRRYEVPFHTDATHALGRIPIDVQSFEPDLLSFDGRTIHAPSGIGGFYVAEKAEFMPMIFGVRNSYEAYRGGPLNLPGIVGLGKAVELAVDALEFEMEDTRDLRDLLEESIKSFSGVSPLISWGLRVPNTLLASFEGVQSEALLYELDRAGVQAYSCTTHRYGRWKPRSLPEILQLDPKLHHTTVGFALSRFTTKEEIDHTIQSIEQALEYLRSYSSVASSQRSEDEQK